MSTITSTGAAAPLPSSPSTPTRKEKDVAEKFSAVFLTEMVDQMMKTVKLGPLDGGQGEETWRYFLARSMADQIAKTGNFGLTQSVERMLSAYDQQNGAVAGANPVKGAKSSDG